MRTGTESVHTPVAPGGAGLYFSYQAARPLPGDAHVSLTPKQERFCREYLKDLNASRAAKRAGYSVRTAAQQGARLLKNANVRRRVSELKRGRAKRAGLTAAKVLADLSRLGAVCRSRAPKSAGHAHAAIRDSELEGKHLGMFEERVHHELEGALIIQHEIVRNYQPPGEKPAEAKSKRPQDAAAQEGHGSPPDNQM